MHDPAGLAARLRDWLANDNEAWTAAHIALNEVPAPAYGEGPRADHFAGLLESFGLEQISIDDLGNVYARYPGSHPGPRLAVSAHLDTVFGPDVDVTVRRDGDRLAAPGISDDAAGLILLPALAAGLAAHEVALPGELWLVATVGEESVGNLRGARRVAERGVAGARLDGFITLDTASPGHVVRHGTHSSNHDITITGPGGHAWGEFGLASPTIAAARIAAKVSEYQPPQSPRTTFNCGILEGGIAPNAIPQRARLHLNLRSADGAELAKLVRYATAAIEDELARANRERRHGDPLTWEQTVTTRGGGETPADSKLVLAAIAAASRLDQPVTHPCSSTDANAFMAAGIDAVCLYRGDGGGEHTLEEWFDAATRPAALGQLAETVLRYFAG